MKYAQHAENEAKDLLSDIRTLVDRVDRLVTDVGYDAFHDGYEDGIADGREEAEQKIKDSSRAIEDALRDLHSAEHCSPMWRPMETCDRGCRAVYHAAGLDLESSRPTSR